MNCSICNSSELYRFLQIDRWHIVKCEICGHAVTEPFPTENELRTLYDTHYFDSHYETVEFPSKEFHKRLRPEKDRLNKFILPFKKEGELLDIGCGRGYFLHASSKHFTPTGFDISAENAAFIQDTLNINIKTGSWEDISFKNKKFDVITLWHSLEHFPDPKYSLNKTLGWLKDDGVIVINVPMHNCIDVFNMKEQWPNWDVPFHLHHFSKNSLHKLLKEINVRVIHENTFHSEHIKDILHKKLFFRLIARNVAKCFDGGHLAVVCRKEGGIA